MSNHSSPLFLHPDIGFTEADGGTAYLWSNTPVNTAPVSVLSYLEKWASERPDTVFLAERKSNYAHQWRKITYREFFQQANMLAANLSRFSLSEDHPLMLVSGNSINNALLMFACFLRGVPMVPVSPSYSLLPTSYEKVHHIQALTGAKTVFAEHYAMFAGVLESLKDMGLSLITADNTVAGNDSDTTSIHELLSPASASALTPKSLTADSVAKIMFTSGSTGMPKGVINTHKMLTVNQEAIAQIWPFIEQPNHVFLDWLPWHHTFGGNHNLNMVLRNGATLYIDNGKPTPEGIKTTVANIKDVSPTLSFNVATGYDLLASELEKDPEAARCFVKNLNLIFFAATALPQPIWRRLEALIEQYTDRSIPITSSWGQTESAPLCTSVYFDSKVPNNIGLPIPGVNVKLAPVGDMTELRVKGLNIMPGYLNDPKKTQEAFDEEGYLCSGDAVELYDTHHPELGLIFRGRVSENFKLLSGTWVNVGELRLKVLAALSPLVSDIAICGQNQTNIGILIFPNIPACREFTGENLEAEALANHAQLKTEIARRLSYFNRENNASSKRINNALILPSPPSFVANEITDKGYLNQQGVVKNRDADVQKLYAQNPPSSVIFAR